MQEQPAIKAEAPVSSPEKKKNNLRVFVIGLLGAIVVIGGGVIGGSAYAAKNVSTHPFVMSMADTFHFAAVKVNDREVPYTAYIRDLTALKSFYKKVSEQPVPITDEQISDQVLVRLTANTILAELAQKFDVKVSDEDLAPEREKVLSEFPSEEEAQTQIMDLYGWTFDEFVDNVVRPLALEDKLQQVFLDPNFAVDDTYMVEEVHARHILFQPEADESDDSVKARAQVVLDRIKAGEDFATLALEFGTDGTKDVGGDLGFFARGLMVPEFEAAAFVLEPGQLSDELVQTQFGYHIVQVDEKRMNKDFTTFVNTQLEQADIELKLNVHDPFADITKQ
ncbi:MAG: hypothetical protein GW939_01815 [Candidatus Magasanikbacteria bacterium]|nr:hypothetical protein [Candidatus Magasanikbacteria bacterium]